jgi:hypothetical protein
MSPFLADVDFQGAWVHLLNRSDCFIRVSLLNLAREDLFARASRHDYGVEESRHGIEP